MSSLGYSLLERMRDKRTHTAIVIDEHVNYVGIANLGGFIMQRIGRLPRKGDKFINSDYEFNVARMDGQQVHTVMISPSRKTSIGSDTEPVDDANN